MQAYRTVKAEGFTEVTIQRSRFLARCTPMHDAAEAVAYLEAVQKRHWDASHHCYAYILDEQAVRFSDAGEPAGTAGMPILEVLRAKALRYVLCVVTRYFGGVLLGAGGLVRAYTRSAAEGVAAAGETWMRECARAVIELPYEQLGKVKHMLQSLSLEAECAYGAQVTLETWVNTEDIAPFEQRLTQLSDGRLHPQWMERAYRPSGE